MIKKKKIVIVDDFTGVRSIVRETLEKKGYQVLEASNGDDALKFFDGTQVDLLITDFDMPDMNGAQLVAKIREMTRYMYTPVIMLSGVRKERVDEEIKGLNVACFLQKPFEIKQFYTIIERLA
ncbi:MAG: response regulator [Alphaproteobacteria bacterium]|nr:MAG: response regulator [Alphaproteobacteria bacterium]